MAGFRTAVTEYTSRRALTLSGASTSHSVPRKADIASGTRGSVNASRTQSQFIPVA